MSFVTFSPCAIVFLGYQTESQGMNLLVILFLNDVELGYDKELFVEMSERNRFVILLFAQMVAVGK